MKELFVIDGANFLFRSYFAIAPMTSPAGASTNALFGFIRSVFKIVKDFSPSHLVIVFDGPDNKKSRTALYPDYKSHRQKMPDDLFAQMEKAIEFCQIAGIAHLVVPGVEADDVMGSIAHFAKSQGTHVFLCSSDKDLCQLVDKKTFVINPSKDNLMIDEAQVEEIFGVKPHQMIDYLAIIGDSSDNIPGLAGFGPKTATGLLAEFGNLTTVLASVDKIKGDKKKQTLIEQKEIALLSYKLATIQTDLEVPRNAADYAFVFPRGPAVAEFYSQQGFITLLKELQTTETVETDKTYTLVNTEQDFEKLLTHLQASEEICFDLETTSLDVLTAEGVGFGFCTEIGTAFYVPLNGALDEQEIINRLLPIFADTKKRWIGHNLKYDCHILLNLGIPVPTLHFDTIIASYLLHPESQRHGLDKLALEYFQHTKIPITELIGKGKNEISMRDVPLDQVCTYCAEDVDYTLRLKDQLLPKLEKEGLLELFSTLEMPMIEVLLRMERYGIHVDDKILQQLSQDLGGRLTTLADNIYAAATMQFNINSPKQLSQVLFEKLQIKPAKKTQTGFSTSIDVLESLAHEHIIIPLIIEYRHLEKLRSTYADTLPTMINRATGNIHPTWNQTITATGRLSCQDPNLQNIPIRSPDGRRIRQAFIPKNPDFVFLAADYSQIELRLLAHLSEDPILVQAFQDAQDVHAVTAAHVFHVPLAEVTREMRHQAKAVNFGIIYGQQAFGLAQELGISQQEAALFIKEYFAKYPRVKDYIESSKEEARKHGYAITLTGRKRPLPELHNPNIHIRSAAERFAVNTPLQGTNADIIKRAMLSIDKSLLENPEMGKMQLQIHDELLFETHKLWVDTLKKMVVKHMENALMLRVPLVVDVAIGKNWEEC